MRWHCNAHGNLLAKVVTHSVDGLLKERPDIALFHFVHDHAKIGPLFSQMFQFIPAARTHIANQSQIHCQANFMQVFRSV